MVFKLDTLSPVPIYVQIKNQVIVAIASGEFAPGDRLPSVRALSEELEVNMHTVNKAYLILREEGYITLDRRRGALVSPPAEIVSPEFTAKLTAEILPLAAGARCKGLGRKEFRKLCTQVYESLRDEKEE